MEEVNLIFREYYRDKDGGYLPIGGTNSSDINVSGWHVGYDSNNDPHWDAWVVKLDNKGNIEWQKC